jgi:arylamine N-acetyltransferase
VNAETGHGLLETTAGDSSTLKSFLTHFAIASPTNASDAARLATLCQVVRAFSRLPYENLTKIIKFDTCPNPQQARRSPQEILADHKSFGAGGTCFSLTVLLLLLVRSLGFRAEPLLADRHYGQDTHSALIVWLGERPHLLDPGYLILEPLALDNTDSRRLRTAFNELLLIPQGDGQLQLHTIQGGRETYRLTFKTQPADAGVFLKAWDASFGWDMMRYPLLTRVADRRQLYLQGARFQVRTDQGVEREQLLLEGLPAHLERTFGVAPELAQRALRILQRKGERLGKTRRT